MRTSYGIVNLHPSRGTHWVLYIKDCYFDSCGCPPTKELLNYLKIKHKKCFYSDYLIQKNDSFCASYSLYILKILLKIIIILKIIILKIFVIINGIKKNNY